MPALFFGLYLFLPIFKLHSNDARGGELKDGRGKEELVGGKRGGLRGGGRAVNRMRKLVVCQPEYNGIWNRN